MRIYSRQSMRLVDAHLHDLDRLLTASRQVRSLCCSSASPAALWLKAQRLSPAIALRMLLFTLSLRKPDVQSTCLAFSLTFLKRY